KDMFAQPKPRGRAARAAATPPLRELGEDPNTRKPIVLKEGRWGPYATDGETNASLRKGDDVTTITLQRAAELLAERRAAGPAAPRRRAGGTATRAKTAAKTTKTTKTAKPAGKAKAAATRKSSTARPAGQG